MRIVTAGELEAWLGEGRILEQDVRGPKVVLRADGLILKIFRARRHLFLARLRPLARRFARNMETLKRLGIPAPEVLESLWLDAGRGISASLYRPLPGETLESLFARSPEKVRMLLPELARFIRKLHRNGIYFRSLHLGNILLLPSSPCKGQADPEADPETSFGLIDFLDLKRGILPLGPWRIRRNFQHLRASLARRESSQNFPMEELCRLYWSAGQCASKSK